MCDEMPQERREREREFWLAHASCGMRAMSLELCQRHKSIRHSIPTTIKSSFWRHARSSPAYAIASRSATFTAEAETGRRNTVCTRLCLLRIGARLFVIICIVTASMVCMHVRTTQHTVYVSVSFIWTYHEHPQNVCYWLNRTENCITAYSTRELTADRATHEEKRIAHQRFSIKRNVNVLTGEPQTFSVAPPVQCALRNLTGGSHISQPSISPCIFRFIVIC